jgi:hypothetical protein
MPFISPHITVLDTLIAKLPLPLGSL